ncbi:protease pro-enzyme activation domain-containing protein [Kitasatospora aureofaciens]|uniref:S53 family peptidase n=1 Tax=Kitasatospora aureofaciens TaxID=1894 RepID=UPI0037C7E92B
MTEQHVVLEGSKRPSMADATRVADADAQAPVSVTVTLRGKVVTDGRIPPERREDAEKTKAVLERYGLTVDEVRLQPGSVVASGPVSAMNAAFQTDLGIYRSAEQGELRGREGELKIPSELAGVVTGVFGLDERRVARRATAQDTSTGVQGPFTPADLERHYDFPDGLGEGQKIGIAEFAPCGYFGDDLQAFCDSHNLPTPHVDLVPLGFRPPQTLPAVQKLSPQAEDGAGEVMMDVEIIAGLCPAAQIPVYFVPWTQKGWIDLIDQAIADQPVTLSVSYGLPEEDPQLSPAARDEVYKRLEGAAGLGITVCVASGDDGAGAQVEDGAAHVSFPSTSEFALAVGGTEIDSTGREVSWWESPGRRTDGGGASGGGVSAVVEPPQWQDNIDVAPLNENAPKGRVVPDVAALAGAPGYDVMFEGQPRALGGTSAATPVWAALVARVDAALPAGKRQRFLTPLLYKSINGQTVGQAVCRDISTGHDNGSDPPSPGYPVQAGFDAVTGWGIPSGTALVKELQSV